MRVIKLALGAAALAFTIMIALPASSFATALSLGQPWGEFLFGAPNSFAVVCTQCEASAGNNSVYLGAPPWTFTGPGFLIVQDAFIIGDQFRVFDNDVAIGDTSAPIGSGDCGNNPVDCFANANVSHGIFTLGGGNHSFTIQVLLNAPGFTGGAGYLCVDAGQNNCGVGNIGGETTVPEPDSIILLGLSLAAVYCWAMRRRISECYVRIRSNRRRR